jgi:hypothetical protein
VLTQLPAQIGEKGLTSLQQAEQLEGLISSKILGDPGRQFGDDLSKLLSA